MNLLWAAIGTSVGVFLVGRAWSRWHPAAKDASLGSLSDQWLAEQRLNRPDSHR